MENHNLTERAQRVMQRARDESRRLRHEFVGTEHLLLGLISDDDGIAVAALTNLGVDFTRVRQTIELACRSGNHQPADPAHLPLTSRTKKILELAQTYSRDAGLQYVGTEHLLVGIMLEGGSIAANVLADQGLTAEAADREVRRLLFGEPS